MLAAKLDSEDQIKFPTYATRKLDGIRCLVIDGKAVTRKFKVVPNHYIRTQIEKYCPDGFDGEIMSPGCNFNELQSKVMSQDGKPEFEYHVFDYVKDRLDKDYLLRIADLLNVQPVTFVKIVKPELIDNKDDLLKVEVKYLKEGYEGIILRTSDSPYKCGRSTVKQQWLMKLKRFKDSEAEVLGIEQLMHNANEATIDELGHTKRSKAKANMVPVEKLGAFVVRDIKTQVQFKVSTGMNDEQRLQFWQDGAKLIGKLIKYKYQAEGMKNLPRFPVFLGFRDRIDL